MEHFAEFFKKKVDTLVENANINYKVFNGRYKCQVQNKDFLSKEYVKTSIQAIKLKNCKGNDRIPQRILVDGLSELLTPFTVLLKKVYYQRTLPSSDLCQK